MIFPTLCINNFFDDPNEIVDYANKLEYFYDINDGIFPGKRTKLLHKVNYDFFNYINKKILRLYYPDNNIFNNLTYEAQTVFQKINYDDVEHHITNEKNKGIGFIHQDPCLITYLTKNIYNSGTSIWKRKSECKDMFVKDDNLKISYYLKKKVDEEKYKKQLNDNINNFDEIFCSKAIYNSFCSFDSNQFHSGNFNMKSGEERLILITFINKLNVPFYPITEMRKV